MSDGQINTGLCRSEAALRGCRTLQLPADGKDALRRGVAARCVTG
jgi:hypothetical protein